MLSRIADISHRHGSDQPGGHLAGTPQAVKEHGVKNAVVLTGFGSVRHSHFHVVMSNDLPPAESYPKSPQPLDIVAIGGMIIDDASTPTSTSPTSRNGFGGHLEEGCLALTFTVVALADLGEVKLSTGTLSRTKPNSAEVVRAACDGPKGAARTVRISSC